MISERDQKLSDALARFDQHPYPGYPWLLAAVREWDVARRAGAGVAQPESAAKADVPVESGPRVPAVPAPPRGHTLEDAETATSPGAHPEPAPPMCGHPQPLTNAPCLLRAGHVGPCDTMECEPAPPTATPTKCGRMVVVEVHVGTSMPCVRDRGHDGPCDWMSIKPTAPPTAAPAECERRPHPACEVHAPVDPAPLPHAVELKREHDWITGATNRINPTETPRVSPERLAEAQADLNNYSDWDDMRHGEEIDRAAEVLRDQTLDLRDAHAQLAEAQREIRDMQAGVTGQAQCCPNCSTKYWTPGNLDIALHADREWRASWVKRMTERAEAAERVLLNFSSVVAHIHRRLENVLATSFVSGDDRADMVAVLADLGNAIAEMRAASEARK